MGFELESEVSLSVLVLEFLVLSVGAPLVAASLTGLLLSLLQAVTQVQEQTIVFVVRLISGAMMLGLLYEPIQQRGVALFAVSLRQLAEVR